MARPSKSTAAWLFFSLIRQHGQYEQNIRVIRVAAEGCAVWLSPTGVRRRALLDVAGLTSSTSDASPMSITPAMATYLKT